MARLTKRERVMRTMRMQETDRVPLYDILQNDAIIEHYAGERFSPGNGVRITGLAVGRALDMTRMAGGPIENPQTIRLDNGFTHQSERWTSWITERPFSDLPELVDWVKEDILRAQAQTYDSGYTEAFHNHIRGLQAGFAAGDPDGDPAVLIVESLPGLTAMYSTPGQELFAYMLADYPDLVDEWLEALCSNEIRRVHAIAEPGLIPVALTADDIAFKTSTLFSPSWLRSIFMPRLKRLNEAWHDHDTYCIFHSDGNLWPVMDDLIAAGIDGLNPIEVMAGMNIKELRMRYPELVLTGGIDVSRLLTFGSPEEVREVCRKAIEDTDGVGYFMGSTTELHWDVKLDNAIAMFETAWNTPVGSNKNR